MLYYDLNGSAFDSYRNRLTYCSIKSESRCASSEIGLVHYSFEKRLYFNQQTIVLADKNADIGKFLGDLVSLYPYFGFLDFCTKSQVLILPYSFFIRKFPIFGIQVVEEPPCFVFDNQLFQGFC